MRWLDTAPAMRWLNAAPAMRWLNAAPAMRWLNTAPAMRWLNAAPAMRWLNAAEHPLRPDSDVNAPSEVGIVCKNTAVCTLLLQCPGSCLQINHPQPLVMTVATCRI
ncbi:TPA: hypothetical protein ACH3X3_004668 [Trebouxia sp. C0006]